MFATLMTELKRFLPGTLTKVAIVVIVAIPLVYGALYLWAFWAPSDNMDTMRVAVVNEDQQATAEDGSTVNAGQELVDRLNDNRVLDWIETTADDAGSGVAAGSYYFSVTIPQDFSRSIASAGGDSPTQAKIRVDYNDANNALATTLGKTAMTAVRDAVAQQTSEQTANALLVGLNDVSDGLRQASDGAGQVNDGATQVNDGASSLSSGVSGLQVGLGDLTAGAAQLKDGALTLSGATYSLADGVADASDGAAQLADGADQLADGADTLAGSAHTTADGAGQVREGITRVGAGSEAAASVAKTLWCLQQANPAMPLADASTVLTRAAAEQPDLSDLLTQEQILAFDACAQDDERHPAADDTGGLAALASGTAQVSSAVTQLEPGVNTLADGTSQLADGADALAEKTHDLANGAGQLSGGLTAAADGARRADDGAQTLAASIARFQQGTSQANDGAVQLLGGAQQLAAGASNLSGGTSQLAQQLADGASQAPAYTDQQVDGNAQLIGDPVAIDATQNNQARELGDGFAPLFIMLALFVGGVISWLVLRPYPKRPLASNVSGFRTVMAGFAPASIISVLQVGILFAVLVWGIGLHPVFWAWVPLFMLLVSLAFFALQQMLIIVFGTAPGRVMSIILLMLQLTSAGGTYPIETTPDFFQAIHPYMPATYVVNGLRQLILGGVDGRLTVSIVFLVGLLAASLAISSFAASHHKVWTMKRLHPEITV